jgi:hypothetical protein
VTGAGYRISNTVRTSLGSLRIGCGFGEVDIEMTRSDMPAIDRKNAFEDTKDSLHIRSTNIAPAAPRF